MHKVIAEINREETEKNTNNLVRLESEQIQVKQKAHSSDKEPTDDSSVDKEKKEESYNVNSAKLLLEQPKTAEPDVQVRSITDSDNMSEDNYARITRL